MLLDEYQKFNQEDYVHFDEIFINMFPKFLDVNYDSLCESDQKVYVNTFFDVLIYYIQKNYMMWHSTIYDSFARGHIEKTAINLSKKYCPAISSFDICLNPNISIDLFRDRLIMTENGDRRVVTIRPGGNYAGEIRFKDIGMFAYMVKLNIKNISETKYVLCMSIQQSAYSGNSAKFNDMYYCRDNVKYKLKFVEKCDFEKYSDSKNSEFINSIREIDL